MVKGGNTVESRRESGGLVGILALLGVARATDDDSTGGRVAGGGASERARTHA